MRPLELPDPPTALHGEVKAWSQPVRIPTYLPGPADPNPMFLEKRVYQGSSGRVYPLPFIDRIAEAKVEHQWEAVHLENSLLRVMVLPELGGRIHVIRDRTNGYDLVYRQDVIKPALVGLAGPWVSGGIEFNWPQHHRPATYMRTETFLEAHPDGSRTAWFSDHDPMSRMKGMHGVRLRPGDARLDLLVRLHNRTQLVQSFLWWANAAVEAHEDYQSFFPADARLVADHARRAMSTFPRCEGVYYGVDYGRRGREGVPAEERPRQFAAREGRPPADLTWYANIPVPTSYMVVGSEGDFLGGYDHAAGAGMVHVADHHVAPGKKQWTWGNHEFGYAWDRNLTEPDARGVYRPYLELMAGVFTDNQPDFSFLAPGETRTFTQCWYPLQQIGPPQQANREAALSLSVTADSGRIGVVVPVALPRATVRLTRDGQPLLCVTRDLRPGEPLLEVVTLPRGTRAEALRAAVEDASGREVIAYQPAAPAPPPNPSPAVEPPAPADVRSADELYLTGLHLEQYRHATRMPEPYWREALRRDPLDSRASTALGFWHLRRGEHALAEAHFGRALERLLARNGNPYDGEALYGRGLALRHLGREGEAYAAFAKATWNAAWAGPSLLALAEIDCARGAWAAALDHLDRSLRHGSDNLRARDLRVVVLRRLGRPEEAEAFLSETLALDPLDAWARHLAGRTPRGDAQLLLDLALDCARAGLHRDGLEILAQVDPADASGALPMVHYCRAHLARRVGDEAAAAEHRRAARRAPARYCFPSRLEELAILEDAISAAPEDARAPYYLGNLLYDRRRHLEAIGCWERTVAREADCPVAWRNLGIAYFNVLHDPARARDAYERAFAAGPTDARLLYERDQLWRSTGALPRERLVELEAHLDLVAQRDDLTVELCDLLSQTGRAEEALGRLTARRFQPWEGGEGRVLGQHTRARLLLARTCLSRGEPAAARAHLEAALTPPEGLGEVKHLLANVSDVQFALGLACHRCGDLDQARRHWTAAAERRGDFQGMAVRAFSETTYWSALALGRLGRAAEQDALLRDLQRHAAALLEAEPTIDYFATSLPTMLLFEEDLRQRQVLTAHVLLAQACLGLGDVEAGRRHLEGVLRADPNHALARDLLADPGTG